MDALNMSSNSTYFYAPSGDEIKSSFLLEARIFLLDNLPTRSMTFRKSVTRGETLRCRTPVSCLESYAAGQRHIFNSISDDYHDVNSYTNRIMPLLTSAGEPKTPIISYTFSFRLSRAA
jgi:hypothetical protein